ncbi:MAG: nitrate/sulfonate/bicarbonate ABC transporter ATP-binding protein [Cycloclasticus sp. symbiont of Bathymodiolus heckerae]|nr:MAG: nitrate/sulfonate/bicarbonate ABC transporter ATP-binding protein [Cycloclasticus sp. symbiont of Bathymodiolus heckerae]
MNRLTVNIKNKYFPKDGCDEIFTAIKDLYFELSNNEFICIVGPSGCGKTTLLNAIAKLDDDFDGSITMDNESLNENISYVFQTPRLLPWRTVLENIHLAVGEDSALSSITDILQQLGLGDNLHSYPHHLSLGMQRRVALARAFCVPSKLLLMDEPFVSLDQSTARKARQLLLDLWEQQSRNVIFVTHDLNEAIELADRILFLSESPSTVLDDIKISIPRGERTSDNIAEFKQQLKVSNPAIQHLI